VPILALTALAMAGDRARCLQAGMDGYVAKPVRAAELFEAIQKACPAKAAATTAAELRAVTGGRSSSPIDRDLLFETLDGDRSAVVTMIEMFRSNALGQLRQVARAVVAGEADGLREAAHHFKGSLYSIAAKPAAAVALRLETMGRNRDLGEASEALAELERELSRLDPVLDELGRQAA
jgi:HPt (histidine-containing phosphotransfer) domain-containing protein